MSKPRFPNLFIIGAMKAGTSSLHAYLDQHPEIFMSGFKEPQYFAPHRTRWGQSWGQGNPFPEPGIDWYLRLFESAGNATYAGESSTSYTARPWVGGCERRIFEFNPQARLVYLMRDPIERTTSHYWHFVADGREDRGMLTAIRQDDGYVARSNYAMQLKPYIDMFGHDRVFWATLEELLAKPVATFRQLFDWLGISTDVAIDIDTKHNVSEAQLKQTRRHGVPLDTMLKHWRWRRIEWHLPSFVTRGLKRVLYRTVQKNCVSFEPTVEYLRPILQEHTRELVELVGREFPEWTTLYKSKEVTSSVAGRLAGCTRPPRPNFIS